MNNLVEEYEKRKKDLKEHNKKFLNKNEEDIFKEFMFCLLTPQSNAQRCWKAVEEITALNEFSYKNINDILKTKTRFHNKKTERIVNSKQTFSKIKPLLSSNDIKDTRNKISEIVNGYGLKEASHFLRNIGKSNNEIAILDRHILRNLFKEGIIKEQKIKSNKHYLEIEKNFLDFAKSNKIPADE